MAVSPLDKLNEHEKAAIEELRKRLTKVLPTNMYDDTLMFYRFLKAREFNVDKAEDMLRKHIVWRKVFQVDTVLEGFKCKEVFHKYSEPSFLGFDKDGDFISYVPSGKIDTRDLMKCMKMNDYERHLIYCMQKSIDIVRKQNEKTGRNLYQGTLIIDLDKLTIANATNKASSEMFLKLSHMCQDNYPELMKAVYVINAPAYYVIVFSILKVVMSNAMLQKIHVYGQNGWKEALLKVIDADVLPAFLGGNRTDPDGNPLCLSTIYHGGTIPSKFYLTEEVRWFGDTSQVKHIVVQPREKTAIPVEVQKSGSLIHWEFDCNSRDIGFGLFFQDDEKEIEILPIHRFCTSDGTEECSYKTKSTGKYIIIFDNSYSWLYSKEVRYCVTVKNPEQ